MSRRPPDEVPLGALRLVVRHRRPGAEGGPTLRVLDGERADRECLRFDAFARGGHWHADPAGRDEITRIPESADPLEWTLAELRRDLPGYLAKAGYPGAGAIDPEAARRAVDAVEPALRNPPAALDGLEPGMLRARSGEKWRLYGEDVLPLWVADMDFPQPEPVRRVLQRALDVGDLGYPMHPRPTALPRLFAERMGTRFGWEIDPQQVVLLTDVVQGIYVALDRLSEGGEGAVVQTPIYPPFLAAVREMDRPLLENPLVFTESGWRMDLEALRDVAPKARTLLLCHPHNPTGRVFTRAELEAVAEIALENELWVVSDEIHADLVLPGAEHLPFAALGPEIAERTLTLSSASKAFNIAGLRCAVAVFGSSGLRRRFQSLPRHLRGGLNTLGIRATEAAWAHAQPWLDEVIDYLDGSRALVADFLRSEMPRIEHRPPEGTYLYWMDCRDLELGVSPQRFFLERAGVALSEGKGFGAPGEGFVRLNFATSRSILREALERMAEALRRA